MIPRQSISLPILIEPMSESGKARALALIAVLRRDWPGLLPEEIEEGAAALGGVSEVLTALLGILPPELLGSIEREAAEDAAPLTRH
jgi:hypothetical protein